MGQVVSFSNYTPPARFDALPWTRVQVEEAAGAAGPWTVIDTLDLSPLDSDPTAPRARSFTIDNGTGPNLWYRIAFLDAAGDTTNPTTPVQNADSSATPALCSLLDIKKRVPGYEPGDDVVIDDTLSDLIVQESADFMEVTGREIVAMNADAVRVYDITSSVLARGTLPIGDVAAVTQVELFDYDGVTSLGVIASSSYVLTPRARRSWEPYQRLWFPTRPNAQPLLLAPGRTIAISGTFGFREIPDTVRRAVAILTVFRYLNDVAPAGTALGELADKADYNLAASLRAAMDTRDRFNRGPFA